MLCMYRLGPILLLPALLAAAPALYNSTSDSSWRNWTALHGTAQSDNAARRNNRSTLRVEALGGSDALVRSAPVLLRPGKHYELSGWVRTESLQVRDSGRSPIAVGAVLAMGSMPFDVHSESAAGSQDWTHLKLRFTATRAQDSILLRVAESGTFNGRAWFDGITIEEVASTNSGPAAESIQVFGPGYRYPSAGWIYLHVEGKPYERGYQHGYLLHKEIERYMERCASQLDAKSRESAWDNGRITADALFTRGFDDEIREEMQGIADGAAAAGGKWHGRKIDLIDIVTANTITELGELHGAMPVTPTGLEGLGFKLPEYARELPVTDRCSSFAATGKATRDGHMIVAHTTWWPLTLAEQTNIMLDVKPVTGHRVLMQAYPGGIQSGTDWYQNDAGVVLTETTIRQTPFNRDGTPVAFRARKAIQYGDDIDQVVRHLITKNNGLYTNEWIIGDAKNDEIAMFELGTYKTRLWRSRRNEWFGGTEGFYWGNNNGKDANLRLEYQPDPKGTPEDITFSPALRDIRWQQLYREYKGSIDEQFAFLAFRGGPLVSASAMDAKVATAEMASNMMVWAAIGKPNQRERLPGQRDRGNLNDGLYPSGYKLFTTARPASSPAVKATPTTPAVRAAIQSSRLWRGWLLPATDADLWLTAGSAAYHAALSSESAEDEINRLRIHARGDILLGDTPLSQLHSSLQSNLYNRLARHKGALIFDALRGELGDEKFLALMENFYAANTTKAVTTVAFRAATEKAAGKSMDAFFTAWLEQAGIPGDRGGPAYLVSDLSSRFASALIVYGTMAEAGSNRYAAEQFLRHDMFESSPLIKKDFELTDEDLRTHDVVFIGRPESNQALARYADRLGLAYSGAAFTAGGKRHASEYESLAFAAANPLDSKRMVVVLAGNSALGTVKTAKRDLAEDATKVYDDR